MSKVLRIIVDASTDAGKIQSALGHMMIGLGYRIPQGCLPNIEIFRASQDVVREFRKRCVGLTASNPDMVYSDLAHTTTDGSARDHGKNTFSTLEEKIYYHAACCCAEEEAVAHLCAGFSLSPCAVHPKKNNQFKLNPEAPPCEDFVADDRACRFSVVLRSNLTTETSYMAMVESTLQLSQNVRDISCLRLHKYRDASQSEHPGMSEYGCVALKSKKPNSMHEVKKAAENQTGIVHLQTIQDVPSMPASAIALFGPWDNVSQCTAKVASLWKESEKGYSGTHFQPEGGAPNQPGKAPAQLEGGECPQPAAILS